MVNYINYKFKLLIEQFHLAPQLKIEIYLNLKQKNKRNNKIIITC